MNKNSAVPVLEANLQRDGKSLEQLIARQNQLLEQLAAQQMQVLESVRNAPAKPPRKDIWDRMTAVAPIFSAAIIACTGAYFTYSYNQQQIKLMEAQTIEKFFPHLVGDEKSKRAAILAMNSLGNAKLAAKVASVFASEGTVSALNSMAKSPNTEDKEAIRDALYKTLDSLAEKYRFENNYDEALDTYKKAIALKEEVQGKDSPDLADNLDKLASLYEEHGDHSAAQAALQRSAQLRSKRAPADSAATVSSSDEPSTKTQPPAPPRRLDSVPAGRLDDAGTAESQGTNVDSIHADEHDPRANARNNVEQKER